MEWTKERPKEDGFYWTHTWDWGAGSEAVLIEVKGKEYRTVHSEHGWDPVKDITERHVFAGPIQPPSIPGQHAERRGAERVRTG